MSEQNSNLSNSTSQPKDGSPASLTEIPHLLASHVIATAGHVDHGKSTLVKALSGTDPDRFNEEKERGLTIDLGFASFQTSPTRKVAVVDVPGHTRFLKNMLAGIGAVDAVLFVVSAVEGWMPQSQEHLQILEILDVKSAIVALTQIDLVDEELAELAELDVQEHLAESRFKDAEILRVDSISGTGLPELTHALDRLLENTPQAKDLSRPRLWVDRSFSITGSGAVVTGTLLSGSLAVGDQLQVEPAGQQARVRGIQSLHQHVEKISPGSRVALNLSGISHNDIQRGDVVISPNAWHSSKVFDAKVKVLASAGAPLSRRGSHVVYLGSGEHSATLRVLGPDQIPPGETGFVRLRIKTALPMLPGDRFVLRDSGRQQTIGGGEILDIDPTVKASLAQPDKNPDRVLSERGWVEVNQFERLTGERRTATLGDWIIAQDVLEKDLNTLESRVLSSDGRGIALAELDEKERVLLQLSEKLKIDGTWVREVGVEEQFKDHPVLVKLRENPLSPAVPGPQQRGELAELVRRKLVISTSGLFFAKDAAVGAAEMLESAFDTQPDGLSVSEIRELWGTSRKFALALLGYFDENGITKRNDDRRVRGARLEKFIASDL